VTGCINGSSTAANAIEDEPGICGGDAIAALRITLNANTFVKAEIDRSCCGVIRLHAWQGYKGAHVERD
jgi:hypothetical protein